MCGRYTVVADADELSGHLDAPWRSAPLAAPRFNIAPTQHAPVLLRDEGQDVLDMYRWGLIPFWAKDAGIGNRMINARAETVREKPAFRRAFERRRCLVPTSGFFEWQKTGAGKVPHWIHPADGGLLTLAGLWERWTPADAEPVYSYTILTTAANSFMQPLHERMPVIVADRDRNGWLDSEAEPEALAALLRPAPEALLAAHPVSTWVNAPGNDATRCIEASGGA
jgi:putative SOS response-associated peptidase YedK